MSILWFWIVALMLTAYVVLDGFDLGVGIVYLFVARTEAERGQALRSIGPVWDGNEVWLLAAGGTLFSGGVQAATRFTPATLAVSTDIWAEATIG